MRNKTFLIFSTIIFSEMACFGGVLDVWVSRINGYWITPTRELVAFPGDVLGIDVMYINEPGYYLFSLSSVLYIEGCGFFDISQAKWNSDYFEPALTGIEYVVSGVKMWGIGNNMGLPGAGYQPVPVLEQINVVITGGDNMIRLLDYGNTPAGITFEIDDDWNIYENVYYGYGILTYVAYDPHWWGDFDCDHKVNFVDFAILAQSWRSSFGEDNYNPNCNLGSIESPIDFKELLEFADYWLVDPIPPLPEW